MKSTYNGNPTPADGKAIGYSGGELQAPDTPIIPFIEGDGTGRDIWKASRRVFDAAVKHAYSGKRRVAWLDRKSTRLNSSHSQISYAVFCLKKKNRLYTSHST